MRPTLLLAVIGVALTGWIGYHSIYLPHQQAIEAVHAQVAEEHDAQAVQASVARSLKQVEDARRRFAPEPDASWLIHQVAAVGREAGIELSTIEPEPLKPVGPLTRLGVRLNFSTGYHQLGTFLDYLERADHLLRVEQLSVRPTGGASEATAAVTLVISAFYLPAFSSATGG